MVAVMVTNWIASFQHKRRLYAITKVSALFLLIIFFLLNTTPNSNLIWFLIALIFSLAGDILLLFPTRVFLLGLLSFLLAQVAYIIGFNQTPSPVFPAIIGLLVILGLFLIVFMALEKEVKKKPDLKRMRLSILLYVLMLSTMALSAGLNLFKPVWQLLAAALTTIGGMLFLVSDFSLAYNRLLRPFKVASLLVIVTYHLAQLALIGGVLVQFSQ